MLKVLVTLLSIAFAAHVVSSEVDSPADEPIQDGQLKSHYVIGVEDVSFYPYLDFRSHSHKGYLSDVMERFAEQQGITFTFVPLPINRFQYWYEEHQIDFRLPDSPDWNADDNNLVFSEGIINVCAVMLVLAKNQHKPMSQFRSIGTILGFTPTRFWTELIRKGEVEVVEDSSPKVLANMLEKGFVDGVDLTYSTVRYQMDALGKTETEIAISSSVPIYQLAYSLSTKKHTSVIKSFNHFLQNYQEERDKFINQNNIVSRQRCQGLIDAY